MAVRKPGYRVGVLLLATLFSAPQILLAVVMGGFAYANRTWPILAFDWLTLIEAVNLRLDDPIVPQAKQIGIALAIWLLVSVTAIWVLQAVWGVTPGKWLCRLRTVRTSLRPCGFAANLAREFVLFVDCGNFLCWAPGIASIALTERRQRLGDLVADTIVVNSRSLSGGPVLQACSHCE